MVKVDRLRKRQVSMENRGIESKASKTADVTCTYRALSFLENNPHYKSDDWVAPMLLPLKMKPLIRFSFIRRLLCRLLGPQGMYEWVIVRTKYIDEQFQQAGQKPFQQVLILGAGFDSRCVRFQRQLKNSRIFELDAASTQLIKITQFRKRKVILPDNVTFIPVNFETESMTDKLDKAGFQRDAYTLILLEDVLQYLNPTAANETLQNLQGLCGQGSRLILDFAHQSTLKGNGTSSVEKWVPGKIKIHGKPWLFGLDKSEIQSFVEKYGFKLLDHKSRVDFERDHFADFSKKIGLGMIGTQSILTAEIP